jgi:hypothetical protein
MTCKGCQFENCDGSTEDIANCVCCKRINEDAKKDNYKPSKKVLKEGK